MDLKEFWNLHLGNDGTFEEEIILTLKDNLGLFFWDRGGKEWAWMWDYNLKDCILQAKQSFRKEDIKARDFLDCLACLEKTKVKELIKELKEGVEK
jgi:hypothetical protein